MRFPAGLRWRLFAGNVIIILTGVITMILATNLFAGLFLDRLPDTIVGGAGEEVRIACRRALQTALLFAASAATITAVVISLFFSRRIVAPLRAMMLASRRIAGGHYSERVQIQTFDRHDEIGELAQTFNQMATDLEQTEQQRRDLIATVAHELRTPLTSIEGYMDGLIDEVLPGSKETFVTVRREAARLRRLVADLEELSRVESGHYPLSLKPVDVTAVLAEVMAQMQPQFEGKGVTLQAHPDVELPSIMADQDRLCQILVNLLGNALRYTPSGGKVEVRATRQDQMVLFAVADTGIGIGAEHLPHIFERFYRADRSRSRRQGGGSGLGLTIARHLVEQHGGQIWAESTPGQGTTIFFTIPAVAV